MNQVPANSPISKREASTDGWRMALYAGQLNSDRGSPAAGQASSSTTKAAGRMRGCCSVAVILASRPAGQQIHYYMEGVKFHYYGAQGRGQQIRWTLVQGGIPFTDESAAFPPEPAMKAKWTELGGNLTTNVPMIELANGKTYTQSSAVLRYAARKGGLYPEDDEGAYAVDNMIAAVDDYRTCAYKPIFPALMGNPDAGAIAELKNAVIPVHFANFERLLGESEYFVGDKVSVADMTMFDILHNFSFNLFPSIKADFPKLVAFYDRVKALPNISAYMATEQFTGLMAFPCLEA